MTETCFAGERPDPPTIVSTVLGRRPRNECGACGLDFGSVDAFDSHRVGKHEFLFSADRPDGRRCLSIDEIEASGIYALNARGLWSLVKSLDYGRQRSERRTVLAAAGAIAELEQVTT